MFLCTYVLASSFAISFLDSSQALPIMVIATHWLFAYVVPLHPAFLLVASCFSSEAVPSDGLSVIAEFNAVTNLK
jgi:hypothetical protein